MNYVDFCFHTVKNIKIKQSKTEAVPRITSFHTVVEIIINEKEVIKLNLFSNDKKILKNIFRKQERI